MKVDEIKIGSARLILGDCRKILPELPRFDLLLTDPPYGTGFAAKPTRGQRNNGANGEEWDNKRVDVATIGAMIRQVDNAIVWGGNYYRLPPSRGWLAWTKPDAPPSMANVELAWTNINKNAQNIHHSIAATNKERVRHPTQKPLRVIEWALMYACDEVETVFDPFMGSGTTGVACVAHGKQFVGIEIDRRYFDMACERVFREHSQIRLFA